MTCHALRILWPSFLVAGVLEGLVFSVIDPHELRWFALLYVEQDGPAG
jgi:hypothetical protein